MRRWPHPSLHEYVWTIYKNAVLPANKAVEGVDFEIISGGDDTDSVRIKWLVVGHFIIELDATTLEHNCHPREFGLLTIDVQPLVFPEFNADIVCFGDSTQFTDLSKIGDDNADDTNTAKWYWYVDGATVPFDSVQNPKKAFSAGTHEIRLEVISSVGGCVDEYTDEILVRALPEPTITGATEACFHDTVVYYTEKEQYNYVWEVFDGTIVNSITNLDSVKVYWNLDTTVKGRVTVTYSDEYGCRATDSLPNITIYTIPETPEIFGNATPCLLSSELYRYESHPKIDEYFWNVSGGGTIVSGGGSNEDSLRVEWHTSGTWLITLEVTSELGCHPDEIGRFEVTVQPRVNPNFEADTVCYGFETSFTDLSTIGTIPTSDSNTESWYWYFESETTPFADIQHPQYIFDTTGMVNIKLEVISLVGGCINDTVLKIKIDTLPVPTIIGTHDGCFHHCSIFKTDPGMFDYEWVATHGSVAGNAHLDSLEVCWNQELSSELAKIEVTYTDGNGCKANPPMEFAVTVHELPDTPEIDGPEATCIDQIEYYHFVPQDHVDIVGYHWTLDADATITGGSIMSNEIYVKWAEPGIHTISLNVFSDEGCDPDYEGTLEVYVEYPITVTFKADTVCLGYETQFTDLSLIGAENTSDDNVEQWYWYFEDETVPFADVQHPKYEFPAGEHNITLEVISKVGCTEETTLKIYVRYLPEPTITGTLDTCFKQCAIYQTQTGMTNYAWSVNNGTIDGASNLDHVKVCWNEEFEPENGYVKVLYDDIHGCRSALNDSLEVVIYTLPSTPEISGPVTSCFNAEESYQFVPQSGITIDDYFWTVTGGTIIAGGDGYDFVEVRWTNTGTQTITLTVITDKGCVSDNAGRLTVTIPQRPAITGETFMCGGASATYTTQSGKSNYHWEVTGGKITAGATSAHVTVEWNFANITGTLKVSYNETVGCTNTMANTYNVDVIICQLIDCKTLTDKVATEDSVGVGYYTHLDNSWDAVPNTYVVLDSAKYFINDVLYSSGAAPSLEGAKFPARMTSKVTYIAYFQTVSDTCEFNVTIIMACPPTVDDIEEHTYDVIPLVALCWTTNLMTTTYSNGEVIPFAQAYYSSLYPNSAYNESVFGLLYTWYSALNVDTDDNPYLPVVQGICPDGWRLPTLAEYELLYQYDAQDLMSVAYWLNPGNNTTHFDARPAGMYDETRGYFVDLYGATGFWAADSQPRVRAEYFGFNYYCNTPLKLNTLKINGLSVRCVME